jgi:hypothetical protein
MSRTVLPRGSAAAIVTLPVREKEGDSIFRTPEMTRANTVQNLTVSMKSVS